MRVLASIVDIVIVFVTSWTVEIGLLQLIYWIAKLAHRTVAPGVDDYFDPTVLQFMDISLYLGVSFVYYVTGYVKWGFTLGKYLTGIRVVQADTGAPVTSSQAIRRWVGYAFSYFPMGTGYLMVIFHPRKRALHDIISGTQVVRDPRAAVDRPPRE